VIVAKIGREEQVHFDPLIGNFVTHIESIYWKASGFEEVLRVAVFCQENMGCGACLKTQNYFVIATSYRVTINNCFYMLCFRIINSMFLDRLYVPILLTPA